MTFEEANKILRADHNEGCPVGLAKNGDRSFICSSSSDDGGICVYEFDDTPAFWEQVAVKAAEEEKDEYIDIPEALAGAIYDCAVNVISTEFWG